MHTERRNITMAVRLIALCMALTGCAIVETYPTQFTNRSPNDVPTAGSYFLAEHHLVVTVQGSVKDPTISVVPKPVADRRQLLDTGLRLSPLSNDDVTVEINPNGMLAKITTIADDKSAAIIENIAKFIYSPALRAAAIAPPDAPPLFVGQFNPFDARQASDLNAILMSKFSSCVEVEIAASVWSPGCGKRSIGTPFVGKAGTTASIETELVVPGPGVYYRRPVDHRVHLMANGKTRSLTSLQFANASPVLRIDIDRSAFVKRETTIVFAEGAPTSVHVIKPSEALEISKLPLTIASIAIDAPIEALTKRQKLIEAETGLLTAQKNKMDAENLVQDLLKKRLQAGAPVGAVTTTDPNTGEPRVALLPAGVAAGVLPGNGLRAAPLATASDVPEPFRARCLQSGLNQNECLIAYRVRAGQ